MWWNQRRRKEETWARQKPGGDKNPGGDKENQVKTEPDQKSRWEIKTQNGKTQETKNLEGKQNTWRKKTKHLEENKTPRERKQNTWGK
nr:hypothetical protein [Mycoplasmopsis bovis]